MTPVDFDHIIKKAKQLRADGELFAAIDLAKNALMSGGDAPLTLRLILVQIMARAGATNEAKSWYKRLRLGEETDLDCRCLQARLRKDMAFKEASTAKAAGLKSARDLYFDIYKDSGDGYPGINAATISALIGDNKTARAIAGQILQDAAQKPLSHKGYWHYATMAEAYLLNGDLASAKDAIGRAARMRASSLSDRATTLKQLGKLVKILALDDDLLTPLRPHPVMHYSGHMIAAPGKDGRVLAENEAELKQRIGQKIAMINPGAAYGSLASGSDILIAETLLGAGVEVNIILPFALAEFIKVSVRPAGGDWERRFHDCLARSKQPVTFVTDQAYMGDDILFDLCAKMAMGRTLLRAGHTAAAAVQLAVWDQRPTNFPAGTSVDIRHWQPLGHDQHIIDVSDLGRMSPPKPALPTHDKPEPKPDQRVDIAMLFGDFQGFSKLNDHDLLGYAKDTLGIVAGALSGGENGATFVNTWGDGIFAVWDSPSKAALCALNLQERLVSDESAPNLPIRLSLHYGVAHRLLDPVLSAPNYFGAAVSRAARIEPITPAGATYVTEPFAAMLMLDTNSDVRAEYIGSLEAAKSYGKIELYRIYQKLK